ncbi:hypothetical protein [Streptomyces natalensis]|uniref:Carrier domain-containing protein n=1 Tax=Streptomyces natalensis ATCC 27448 TaxID=1240678 RepID=A0A0D7CI82_9ACTN|nr:hypothetical protein [Streptomyces natalensis]KIZ15741.1 hypothetical protein SNA_25100 [Streptomyces natalensis ATCC 27448]
MGGGSFGGTDQAVDQLTGPVPEVFDTPVDAVVKGADDRLAKQDAKDLTERAMAVMAKVLDCDVAALRPETDLIGVLGADEETLAVLAWHLGEVLELDGLVEVTDDWQTVGSVLFDIGELAAGLTSA